MFEYLDSQRIAQRMVNQSKQNHGKWGDQDRYSLMVVLMEEVGEVARAILDDEHDPTKDCFDDIESEIIDTGAVLLQLIHEVNREKQTTNISTAHCGDGIY
jgi:NTP pyrophosphatase (non-canonical NTP hydrolase)